MTLKAKVAVLPVSFLDVAVIVVSPAALQVTLPLASIVATPSLEDFHVTDASALAGLGVMDSWMVAPFFPLASPLMAILFRTTSASFTVIFWVPDFPPASAVIVASPALTPVTLPPSTVAMLLSEEDHFTPSYLAPSGETFADNVILLPTVTLVSPLTDTLSTGTSFASTETEAVAL